MKICSLYDSITGLFNGTTITANDDKLLKQNIENIPDGLSAIEGRFDHLSQRVDLNVLKQIEHLEYELGESLRPGNNDYFVEQISDLKRKLVIDYQPPQPDEDHEWITDANGAKRWQIKPDVAQKRQDKAQTLAQLQLLDASHLRALDEVVSDPSNMVARDRLDTIRNQKDQLRKKLV